MARINKKEKSDGLYQAILTLRTEEEVYDFFQDLCTVTELRAMEQRFEVAILKADAVYQIIEKINRLLQLRPAGFRQNRRVSGGDPAPAGDDL